MRGVRLCLAAPPSPFELESALIRGCSAVVKATWKPANSCGVLVNPGKMNEFTIEGKQVKGPYSRKSSCNSGSENEFESHRRW